jgi:hypothetical protein
MIDLELLVILLAAFLVLGGLAADWLWRRVNRPEDQRAVLRRCYFNLWCVRRDLARLPADREVCDMQDEVDRLNRALIRKAGTVKP